MLHSSSDSLQYSELSLHEHVLHRPDTYVGSIVSVKEDLYIRPSHSDTSKLCELQTLEYIPAIHRLFLEALANAVDHAQRSKEQNVPFRILKVSMNGDRIQFLNDGLPLPVEKTESGDWLPTLLFGKLLTSSNYKDDETRIVAGKNGIGIKCANIFSNYFSVEIGDPIRNRLFFQEWRNHMNDVSAPITRVYRKKTAFVSICYECDFSYFHRDGYTSVDIALFEKYIMDASLHLSVPIVWSPSSEKESTLKFSTPTLQKYVDYYTNNPQRVAFVHDSCEAVFVDQPGFEIAFVNGIHTPRGGVHVDVFYQEAWKILKTCSTLKQYSLKHFRQGVSLFVNCRLINPQFQSQTKDILTSPRPSIVLDEKRVRKMAKWNFVSELQRQEIMKENLLGLREEKKRVKIPGLSPAIKIGIHSSLFITEGQSAKTYATQGIHVGMEMENGFCKGATYFGIYAVRGKPVNVRGMTLRQALENREVHDIISAIGVQSGVDYTDDRHYRKLRYGKIICLCDADNDGYHIVGLLLNIFDVFYPSLLKRPFFYMMRTPIMAIQTRKEILRFYQRSEAERVLHTLKGVQKVFYYKGLGTSTNADIKATFGKCLVEFTYDDRANLTMDNVFHKQKSDQRKQWLHERLKVSQLREPILEIKSNNLSLQTISNFIDSQFIEFSLEDCYRSLPHVMDGFKQSQRKVFYASMCKKQRMKVMQLAGYVSEKTCYHHGEMNLFGTITKMAQNFVGSNNIPLLIPDGQFGSRLSGGKDAANARYIYTSLQSYTPFIFRAEDEPLYTYEIDDDGHRIEPSFYMPIIPMILVNGCISGIGTGFSCSVLSYHPLELIQMIQERLSNIPISSCSPYYHGFRGTIIQDRKDRKDEDQKEGRYRSEGVIHIEKKNQKMIATITELPIGCWTDVFIEKLEKLEDSKLVRKIENHSTPQEVHIRVEVTEEGYKAIQKLLQQTLSSSNMVLFNEHMIPTKFDTIDTIFEYFFQARYRMYEKRIAYCLEKYTSEMILMKSKLYFLENRPSSIDNEEDCIQWCANQPSIVLHQGTYDYLLNLSIRASLQKQTLRQKISQLEERIHYYDTCSVADLWLGELEELKQSLKNALFSS